MKTTLSFWEKITGKFFWDDLRYTISAWFKPRNKWLTKKIPKRWQDKDTIFEICIFEGIKHYAEEEVGIEWLSNPDRWKGEQFVPQNQIDFENEVYNYYKLITEELVRLEKEMDDAWSKVPFVPLEEWNKPGRPSYEERYGKVDKLEREIYNLKTKIMVWAVTQRESMWT